MKYVPYLLFLLVFVSVAAADLTDGLYSYFPMDDHRDVLGFAQSGDIGQVSYTPGLIGNALNVTTDAANSMIYMGESVEDRDSTYRHVMFNDTTINLWFKVREWDALTSGKIQLISGSPKESPSLGGCSLDINNWELAITNVKGCNYDKSICVDNTGTETIIAEIFSHETHAIDFDTYTYLKGGTGNIDLNDWNMITLIYDSQNNIWKLFQNTQLIDYKNNDKSIGHLSGVVDCPYAIGNRPMVSQHGFPFPGLIDEVAFWNRVLSQEEIEQLYNNGQGFDLLSENLCGNGVIDGKEQCDDGNTIGQDGCSAVCEDEVDPLLEEYAPIIHMHPLEAYGPKDISAMLQHAALYGPSYSGGAPTLKSELVADSGDYYLDMVLGDIGNGYVPHKSNFEHFNTTIYGRVIRSNDGYTYLQYFFFYPFQDWQLMDHEGDWEMIQVALSPSGAMETIKYFFNRFKAVYVAPFDIPLEGNHPPVWVALGSHNTYGEVGGISAAPYDFMGQLLARTAALDDVQQYGQIMKPEILQLNPGEESYRIEQLTNQEWMKFMGKWGEESFGPLHDGPKFPKYNARFIREWRHPEDYSDAPNIPFISVFLYSPLDISIYDEDGEIDDDRILLKTLPDHEPESIMVETREGIVQLDAHGDGNFTLEVFYYDNETQSGLMVTYSNIFTTGNATVTLAVSLDSLFTLNIDYDDDGIVDDTYLPTSYLVHGDFQLPDQDSDGVTDFVDNCIQDANPDQEDIDENGKGDACDHPLLYKQVAYAMTQGRTQELITESMNPELWDGTFHVTSHKVFVKEMQAARKDIVAAPFLAHADRLLILKHLEENSQSKELPVAQKFLEKGLSQEQNGDYSGAIVSYMNAWLTLGKV